MGVLLSPFFKVASSGKLSLEAAGARFTGFAGLCSAKIIFSPSDFNFILTFLKKQKKDNRFNHSLNSSYFSPMKSLCRRPALSKTCRRIHPIDSERLSLRHVVIPSPRLLGRR
ncbi:MAG: hypothetical protein ABI378_05785 [Chitinophagaceae bacterium]